MRRRAAIVLLALATAVVGLVLVLHAPFVRSRVLQYALATVQRDYGIRIEASRLDYNLVTLSAGLAGVRVSSQTTPNEPFFEADYVAVRMASSTLAGDVAFDSIGVTNGHVQVVGHRDGTNNLPASSSEPSTMEPPPLRIARIDVPTLRVDVRDEQQDLAVTIPAVTIQLTRNQGRVTLRSPATVRLKDRQTRISQLEGGATFDGRALRLQNVQVRGNEGALAVDGTLVLIARDAMVDVTVKGTADLAALAATERASTLKECQTGARRVWFPDGWQQTPVYARDRLPLDAVFEGPAILEQLDCTTVVEPGDTVRHDRIGNLLIGVR